MSAHCPSIKFIYALRGERGLCVHLNFLAPWKWGREIFGSFTLTPCVGIAAAGRRACALVRGDPSCSLVGGLASLLVSTAVCVIAWLTRVKARSSLDKGLGRTPNCRDSMVNQMFAKHFLCVTIE